jgi:hypothetical protein
MIRRVISDQRHEVQVRGHVCLDAGAPVCRMSIGKSDSGQLLIMKVGGKQRNETWIINLQGESG